MERIMQQLPIVLGALNVGFLQTLKLFFITLLGAFPLGLVIAFGSLSRFKPLQYFSRFCVWIIRGTPLMIQLLIIYYFPGLVMGNNIWGSGESGRFVAAAVAFVVNYACYFSEIYRGGIESIPVGQYEAAEVLGYTKGQTFFRIILPQMVKCVIPSVTNEVITLVKDTSLASVIGTVEMFTRAKQIVASPNTPGMLALAAAGLFYYVFNYIVAFAMERAESSLAYYQ